MLGFYVPAVDGDFGGFCDACGELFDDLVIDRNAAFDDEAFTCTTGAQSCGGEKLVKSHLFYK